MAAAGAALVREALVAVARGDVVGAARAMAAAAAALVAAGAPVGDVAAAHAAAARLALAAGEGAAARALVARVPRELVPGELSAAVAGAWRAAAAGRDRRLAVRARVVLAEAARAAGAPDRAAALLRDAAVGAGPGAPASLIIELTLARADALAAAGQLDAARGLHEVVGSRDARALALRAQLTRGDEAALWLAEHARGFATDPTTLLGVTTLIEAIHLRADRVRDAAAARARTREALRALAIPAALADAPGDLGGRPGVPLALDALGRDLAALDAAGEQAWPAVDAAVAMLARLRAVIAAEGRRLIGDATELAPAARAVIARTSPLAAAIVVARAAFARAAALAWGAGARPPAIEARPLAIDAAVALPAAPAEARPPAPGWEAVAAWARALSGS